MDGLLRGKEQPEVTRQEAEKLFQKAFDFSSQTVLFPVRHHSPACSYHLKKVISSYEPDCILIEGPENAQELLPFAASEKTKTPFCLYLSYEDADGKISEGKGKYRAYYPFLDYSPELTAIREGAKRKVFCQFIDLSYGEKLLNVPTLNQKDAEGLSDGSFLLGEYHKRITEKLGLRSFSELWEMLFEIDGYYADTVQFVKSLFLYCYYSRAYSSEKELLMHGDLARESVMFSHIKKAAERFEKILVITGGIHTIALAESLWGNAPSEITVKREKKEHAASYLMPYSFEESDSLSGYASGMVYPYFYQKVWEAMEQEKKKPFQSSVLRFIINTANTVRKKQALSVADEIQSFYMAKGLGELREKKECGVFEVIDAVKASFVKGEVSSLYQPALKTLCRLMTGMQMGSVDPDAGVPPIVNDFLSLCKSFKIQTNTSLKKETRLDIDNNKQHREKSHFFCQMAFLRTDFCQKRKGEEDQQTGSRILLREVWEYRFAPNVQVALISVSAYGGTVKQAALFSIGKEIKENHHNTKTLSSLLLWAEEMGLDEIYYELFDKLETIISEDMDFFSVTDGFRSLCRVKDKRELLELPVLELLQRVLSLCLQRVLTLTYTLSQIKREEEDKALERLKFLYSFFLNGGQEEQEELFLQNMDSIFQDLSVSGALTGISGGILFKRRRHSLNEIMDTFYGCLHGSENAKKSAAAFLKGFFKVARDVVFVDDTLLHCLDEIITTTTGELFMEILPDLRLAFTDFMLDETDKIAKKVASFYHVTEGALLYQKALSPEQMELAAEVDRACAETMTEWLLPVEQ